MEASQAATGQGEAQTNGDGQAAEQQAKPGLDFSQFGVPAPADNAGQEDQYRIAREIAQQALAEYQQNLPHQQVQAPAEQDLTDLTFLDPAEPGFDPDQVLKHFSQTADAAAKREADALRTELQQTRGEISEIRMEREAEALVYEFPEMQDPEIQRQVVQAAAHYAQELGQPTLAQSPRFWGHVYKLAKAEQLRQEEGAAEAPRVAHLEGAGGAAPSGSQVDLGDLITGAAQGGSSVLPFQ